MRMRTLFAFALVVVLTSVGVRSASAQLIESWENAADPTFDGWTTNLQPYSPSYSTVGATDGTQSLAMTGVASPSYGQMLRSSFMSSLTPILANAQSVSFDVTTPPASFGFFLQFDVDVNNNDSGFVSLDNFSYPAATIGATSTITVPVSAALRSTFASSVNPTQLIFQVGGGSSGNPQTFYIDNVRANPAPVPEPATLGLLSIGGLLALRRRR